jgi:hypothetical protein
MATYTTTTKYALRALTGSSLVSEIDIGFASLAADIDAAMAGYVEGTLAIPAGGREVRPAVPHDGHRPGVHGHRHGVGRDAVHAVEGFRADRHFGVDQLGYGPVDLTTVGPSVTLTVPANARVADRWLCRLRQSDSPPVRLSRRERVSIGQVIEGNSSPSRFYITPTSWQSPDGPLIGTATSGCKQENWSSRHPGAPGHTPTSSYTPPTGAPRTSPTARSGRA